MIYAAFSGFMTAILVILVLAVIWQWAKGSLHSWSDDLTRETLNRLRESELKLDSIRRNQERMLLWLERWERAAYTHSKST
jgi:hypothetical protein